MSESRPIYTVLLAIAALAVSAIRAVAAAPAGEGAGAVTVYATPACYGASQTYALRANGKAVPVIEFSKQYDYAILSLDDKAAPCRLEVTRLDGKPVAKHEISPLKLSLKGAASRDRLTFTIPQPAYLIVSVDDLRKLVIAIDPCEEGTPAASGASIYNVTAAPYNADAAGVKSSTAAIQRAVDDAGNDASKQGIVYIPAGVYTLSELRLVSNVSLYLEAGSVLRLGGTRDQLKVRYHKKSQNRDGTWFIYTADGATNVKIFGRGTIDGDGQRIEKELGLTNHAVVPMNCTGFTLDGVIVRDSGLWGTVIANSRQVMLANTKHFNRLDMGEDDCVDVCNSRDVTVKRSIAISLDDPYSTKCWAPQTDISPQWSGKFDGNRDIVFDDCVAWTRCFAFKVGAGVSRDQQDVIVRNGVVYDSAHAIGISHSYGSADVRNVTFENIDVERNTMTNLGRSWAQFVIDPRKSDGGDGGGVYGVTVRDVTVRDAGTDPVPVQGLAADKAIRGVTFERIRMNGQPAVARTLAQVGVTTEPRFAENISISTSTVSKGDNNVIEGPAAADAHPRSAERAHP